jgi:hypothetical protein
LASKFFKLIPTVVTVWLLAHYDLFLNLTRAGLPKFVRFITVTVLTDVKPYKLGRKVQAEFRSVLSVKTYYILYFHSVNSNIVQ